MSAPRLVAVSNRVGPVKGANLAGGLAVALVGALQKRGGLWFGWSGKTVEADPGMQNESEQSIETCTFDLLKSDHEEYYGGYANRCLWPLCHFRIDLVEYERRFWEAYLRVNQQFAERLAPLLRPSDLVWIHDFHLIPMGRALRELGVKNRIGFFLHTPFPPHELMTVLPEHEQLVKSLFAYDVVGLQTEPHRQALADYVVTELDGRADDDGRLVAGDLQVRSGAFPVGIDAAQFRALSMSKRGTQDFDRMRAALRGRRLIIGVDRLDYSKGLLRRMAGYDALLNAHPEHHRNVEYLQVAPISRGELGAYVDFRGELDHWAARINGRHADVDWTPVRYLNKTLMRRSLAGLYRASHVGLVTPMRDGMNLVAKEYVAAQDPDDPGVLVLSRFAGAAQQMTSALIVNPYDTSAMGATLHQALGMPPEERRARHAELLHGVHHDDITRWADTFVDALVS